MKHRDYLDRDSATLKSYDIPTGIISIFNFFHQLWTNDMPSILSSQKNNPENLDVLFYEQLLELKIVEEINNMSHLT